MKLEINYKKKTAKNTNAWSLNNMKINNQCVSVENQRGSQKTPTDK